MKIKEIKNGGHKGEGLLVICECVGTHCEGTGCNHGEPHAFHTWCNHPSATCEHAYEACGVRKPQCKLES